MSRDAAPVDSSGSRELPEKVNSADSRPYSQPDDSTGRHDIPVTDDGYMIEDLFAWRSRFYGIPRPVEQDIWNVTVGRHATPVAKRKAANARRLLKAKGWVP